MKLSPADVRAAKRELFTRSFRHFVEAAWREIDPKPFIPNWHIDAICEHLEAVADGRIKRLLINIPPGTAKSMLCGVLFPAWMWTHRPSWQATSTSHSFELSTRDTRKSRALITSDWYQTYWPIKLTDDQNQKTYYENNQQGFRQAKPFTSLTGARSNCIIVDDPHSVDSAKSEAERTSVIETFLEAVPNRLNNMDEDAIIVVMQRLHEQDVAGTILALQEEGKGLAYEHLSIPMEYEGGKPKTTIGWKDPRKKDGALLFPKQFSKDAVETLKRSMGPFVYAGQYQQNPIPRSDGFFRKDWFHRWGKGKCPHPTCAGIVHDRPVYLNIYMTSDHAPGGSARGDFNVVRIWGVDKHRNLWLLDSFRKRCSMDEAIGVEKTPEGTRLRGEGALPLIRKWKPLVWFPEADHAWKANKSFIEAFMRETQTFTKIEVLPITGMGDKMGKATAYASMAAMGMVYLPEGEIGDVAILEMIKFPAGRHDDQVDADSVIARAISEAYPAVTPAMEPRKLDDDDEIARHAMDQETFW